MRTSLPTVLAVLLLNDVLLVVALDAAVSAWGVVLGAALALTTALAAVVERTTEDSYPPSRAALDESVRETRADLTRLENRVDELED